MKKFLPVLLFIACMLSCMFGCGKMKTDARTVTLLVRGYYDDGDSSDLCTLSVQKFDARNRLVMNEEWVERSKQPNCMSYRRGDIISYGAWLSLDKNQLRLREHEEHTYDSAGHELSYNSWSLENEKKVPFKIIWTYDKKGNLISKRIENGFISGSTEAEISHDNLGRVIKQKERQSSRDFSTDSIVYSANGKVVWTTQFFGLSQTKFRMEYDQNDSVIFSSEYKSDYSVVNYDNYMDTALWHKQASRVFMYDSTVCKRGSNGQLDSLICYTRDSPIDTFKIERFEYYTYSDGRLMRSEEK